MTPPSPHHAPTPLNRAAAHRTVETAYLAAATGLLFIALYYLPVGGPILRLALPLPLALVHLRHGGRSGFNGVCVLSLLLVALMGPVRGPLVIFPYGLLGLWLGWCWRAGLSWYVGWSVGTVIGTVGLVIRVFVLSVLVGENLWMLITTMALRSLNWAFGLLEPLLGTNLVPTLLQVQVTAVALVFVQNVVYLLSLHMVAYWIFRRLQSPIPEPPPLLRTWVELDPL